MLLKRALKQNHLRIMLTGTKQEGCWEKFRSYRIKIPIGVQKSPTPVTIRNQVRKINVWRFLNLRFRFRCTLIK